MQEKISERESLAELSKRYDVHPNIISKWNKEFLEKPASVFNGNSRDEKEGVDPKKLYAKIGQLEIENDF